MIFELDYPKVVQAITLIEYKVVNASYKERQEIADKIIAFAEKLGKG